MFSSETCENFKNTYFQEHLWTTISENTSRGDIELYLMVFGFQWMFIDFPNFFTIGSISQHDTFQIFMSNASSLYMAPLAGKERNNSQQVSLLIQLKSISMT